MSINLDTETIVSLTEATKVLPKVNGRRPSISTLWRWCRKGLRGVHLEYIRMGRSIATSREALNRFFAALAEADEPTEDKQTSAPNSARPDLLQRSASLEAADRILERARI